MPLRDTSHVSFQAPNFNPDDLSSEQLPSEISPHAVLESTHLDPNASTSQEYNRENNSPTSLTSMLSSHEQFPGRVNSCGEGSVQQVNNTITASTSMPQGSSPISRQAIEGTPFSDRATSVSTMTPPMSPPKVKGVLSSASSTKVNRGGVGELERLSLISTKELYVS
jgi:hypothetical protein